MILSIVPEILQPRQTFFFGLCILGYGDNQALHSLIRISREEALSVGNDDAHETVTVRCEDEGSP